MAIDPRISLAAQVPSVTPAINIFENALNSASNRAVQEQNIAQSQQQMAQADVMNPLLAQQAQQGVDVNAQNIAATRNEARFKDIFQTSQQLKSFIANNDAVGAEQFMLKNISRLQDRAANGEDVDLTESLETLEQIKAGNLQGVAQNITAIESIAQQRAGQLQKTRVTSSKILADGTTVQSLSTGGTNVISAAGDVLTGDARVDALDKALRVDISQKGKGAKAVSDVKIDEVTTLEDVSKEKKLDIERKKVTLDETKAKNKEARDTAINTKNARRKEADAAIVQIDSLLEGDRFSNAFGKVVTTTPELLRRQVSIDAIADVDQVKSLITLESRQKLKGQGTITDSEQAILAKSATVLQNPMISDERARQELIKIKRVFEDSSYRNRLKRETRDRIEAEAGEQSNLNNLSLDELMAERNRLGGQ